MLSSVSGGEWSHQAEWGPGRSGAGRAAGVWGALATLICISQWEKSLGFYVPQWHQGEFSEIQHSFSLSSLERVWCHCAYKCLYVPTCCAYLFTLYVYSVFVSENITINGTLLVSFLLPQLLTVTNIALPMSEVFTVQWALWCTEACYLWTYGSACNAARITQQLISLSHPNRPGAPDARYGCHIYGRSFLLQTATHHGRVISCKCIHLWYFFVFYM